MISERKNMIRFGMPVLTELKNARECAMLAHGLGLDFVEVNMSFPQYQLDCIDIEEYLAISREYGIFFTIHADESFDPCNVNSRIARVYVQDFLNTLELAKLLAVPSVNMHLLRGIAVTLPERKTYIYGENEARYLASLRDFRDRVTDRIGDAPLRVNVENTDGYDQPFLLHALDTLLESPAFGLTYDIGHDHAIAGRDAPVISARAERLHHMHMHDGSGSRVHLALGDGEMDIPSYLDLAREHNCTVVLETKTVAALKRSVEYLKNEEFRGRFNS